MQVATKILRNDELDPTYVACYQSDSLITKKISNKDQLRLSLLFTLQAAEWAVLAYTYHPAEPRFFFLNEIAVLISIFLTSVFSGYFLLKSRCKYSKAIVDLISQYSKDGVLLIEENAVVFSNSVGKEFLDIDSPSRLRDRFFSKKIEIGAEIKKILIETEKSITPILYDKKIGERTFYFLISRVNHPYGTAIIFHDITFLRENEEAKVHFIGTLSHEIKTPITSLAMSIYMLERNGYDSELLRIANADVKRLKIQLDDLLNISKLNILRNTGSLQKRDTNLSTLTNRIIEIAKTQANHKGITFDFKLHPMGKGLIKAHIDPTNISWVFSTLLNDAIYQSEQGSSITAFLRAEDSRAIFGIEFEKHHDSVTTTSYDIVNDIVEAHSGQFAILRPQSGFGKKSQFILQLNAHLDGGLRHEAHIAG